MSTDPVIYRLFEMVGVYGKTIKELMHEKCGDGIMSAIHFRMNLSRKENENGDRARLDLSGKLLPYRSW